jgi:LuxR family maltose regulon positive regulatory protein
MFPGCADRSTADLDDARDLDAPVAHLIDALRDVASDRSVLLVDDVHLLDETDELAASIQQFVQHAPDWLHVVLSSRREPRLPLDRLRARGEVVELRFRELLLSPDEATEMLRLEQLALPEAQIESVVERADGWAAALELAVPAARTTDAQDRVDDFDAEYERLLRNYVLHEVLGEESTEDVAMLGDLSIVDRINPGLAAALLDGADAERWLQRAEARSIVTGVVPAGWYEVHSLVRTVLKAELASRFPDRLEPLHRRAAQWYERSGDVPAALEHLLLGGEPRAALRLLAAKHADLYDDGDEATIRKTVASIPSTVAMGDVDAIIELAWSQLLTNRHEFAEVVDHLQWRVKEAELEEPVRMRVSMLAAFRATMHGDWASGAALARSVEDSASDQSWRDPLARFSWNMVARDVALDERWDDTADETRELEIALARDPERRLALDGTRAVGLALAGRPVDALRTVVGIRRIEKAVNMSVLSIELALAEAIAHRELGERDRAREELRALFEGMTDPMLYAKVIGGLELAQLHLDDGDPDRARHVFDAVEALTVSEQFGVGLRGWLARVGTLVALGNRRHDEAQRWARQADDPFWSAVSAARVHLADDAAEAARADLADVVARCPRHTVVLHLLRARAVDAAAEAEKDVLVAVETAVGHSMLQTVASEGPDVPALVEPVAWDVPKAWMDRLRRAAGRSGIPMHASALLDSLTDREREVLRFLPSRLTVREIASELYISVNTLKFHLRVIYRKLNVSSRAEAVEIVRDVLNH